ncbi:histone H1-III-like [Argiope bruennichi]|uniref:Histone H1 like protein n=1 Tax=Argiope bruennichi TaxID=94029 RepID=A0A8T0FNZ4_ARGBR|nr:histone H1-III-like [Argiope bruennichi]KAF8792055.1 Histone H1 like protein [Argiope bruennichi]
MVDVVNDTPTKKAKTPKVKKPKTAPTHPKVSEMVNAAIGSLKERGGSSVQAIKKYIKANYKVDAEKLSPFIKKYLKTAVASGGLVQTKGKGATGSFRIGGSSSGTKEKKAAAKPKKAAVKAAPKPKKPKATTPKKAAKPKKAAAAKPKKSPTKKAKPATPKKVAKPKTVKAKTPKAKKPKATPKKAAAKKGKK